MRETNFTLGPIQKSLYLLLLYQFTFAQNRPKSDISGALGPIHYITLKAFAMASGDGTKCFGGFGYSEMATRTGLTTSSSTPMIRLGESIWYKPGSIPQSPPQGTSILIVIRIKCFLEEFLFVAFMVFLHMGVLEWFYMLTEKILFQNRGLFFITLPRPPPRPPVWQKTKLVTVFFGTLR